LLGILLEYARIQPVLVFDSKAWVAIF